MRSARSEAGQATVELVAILPLVAVVVMLLWQSSLAGAALWLSSGAARAAARAEALGADPLAAARAALPGRFEHGLKVEKERDGGIELVLGVPAIVGDKPVTTVSARARFEQQ
jgi:hypothetical protein